MADLRLDVPQFHLELLHIGLGVAVGLLCWVALARAGEPAPADGSATSRRTALDREPAELKR